MKGETKHKTIFKLDGDRFELRENQSRITASLAYRMVNKRLVDITQNKEVDKEPLSYGMYFESFKSGRIK